MRLDKRAKGTAVLSDCCDHPFAYIRDSGKVTITMPHNRESHMLVLSPADLRKLADEAEKKRGGVSTSDILGGEKAA